MRLLLPSALFVLRLFNAFTIKTFFQPDEYFQCLEVAHFIVFGYGYWTWEWREALRSSIHPLFYALGYKTATLLTSEGLAVRIAPKFTGAIIAALVDYYVYKFAKAYWLNERKATLALALSLCSSWNWFIATRSFLNNLEMLFTVVGLSYWPWHHYRLMDLLKASFFGLSSCLIRPSNASLWGSLGVTILLKNYKNFSRLMRLLLSLSVVSGIVLLLSAIADRYVYGYWTFPLYTFVEFNVMKNLLLFYGTAPWHFYLFQGIPLMLMMYLPLFLAACYRNRSSLLVWYVALVIMLYSGIDHKEFRFLNPIHPIFLILCADALDLWRKWQKSWMVAILHVHIPVAFFFTRIHEIGEIDVVNFLRDDASVESVGFLTPCHSTPWQSVLHRADLEQSSWFLTCEPPLHLTMGTHDNMKSYRDELDRFFDDPAKFLENMKRPWPSHLVVFQPIVSTVQAELPQYTECQRFFNSHFHWDPRRNGDIVVFCMI